MAGDSWCTIESDPGVFTELLTHMGVKGVQVEELYSMSEDIFRKLGRIYGLIFLFKWRHCDYESGRSRRKKNEVEEEKGVDPDLFFATQVVSNACATQAVLSIVLNTPEIDLGEQLRNFKTFTRDFPPDLKGLAISNCQKIRDTHNSFARAEPFIVGDSSSVGGSTAAASDAYHFIAYLPIKGRAFELDGLKDAPVCLGGV